MGVAPERLEALVGVVVALLGEQRPGLFEQARLATQKRLFSFSTFTFFSSTV